MNENLSKWVHDQLNQRGWSLRELGRRSGIDHSILSKIFNGKREPNLPFYRDLAKAFGVSLEEILRIANELPSLSEGKVPLDKFLKITKQLTPDQRENVAEYALWLIHRQHQ